MIKRFRNIFQLTCLAALISCGLWSCDDKADLTDGDVIFNLSNKGEPVDGEQIKFAYGETINLLLYARYAPYIEITAPAGWTCTASVADEVCTITAPDVSEMGTAQAGGEIRFDITSRTGKTLSTSVNVTIVEGGVVFAFEDATATATTQIFSYEETKTYTFTTENVADLAITHPKGWTVTRQENTLSVKSPAESDTSADISGTVSVTPKSPLGVSGAEQKIAVVVDANKPSISFEKTSYSFVFSADNSTINFTPEYVSKATVISNPEGWTVSADPAGTLTVSSPAVTDTEADGIGKVVIEVENSIGTALQYDVTIRLTGIADSDEFMAFCVDYEEGNPLDNYMQGGELILVDDIDLTVSDKALFVDKIGDGFGYPINGWGRTIKLDIASDTKIVGIFHTLTADSGVKNLTVEGSITSSNIADDHVVGGITAYNNGASFENVTTNIDFTYAPEAFANKRSHYGSLAGISTAATYNKCISNGKIKMNYGSMRRVGGMVGFVETKGVTMTDCENTGELELIFGKNGANNCHYGGILGNSEHIASSYYNCVNRGKITVDFDGGTNYLHSLGGLIGCTTGLISGCKNYGVISANESRATRRYGGIVGSCPSAQANIEIVNCENHGDINHTSTFAGGVVGIVENCPSSKLLKSKNYGNITNIHATSSIETIGGVVAGFFGDEIRECENHGKLSGFVYKYTGGIAGRCQNGKNSTQGKTIIADCTNAGEIATWTNLANNTTTVTSGIATMESGKYEISGCTNTGAIKPVVNKLGTSRAIWGYYSHVVAGTSDADVVTADDDSTAAQADKTLITETLAAE